MSLPVLLKNPKILLLGAGNVALQKAKVLNENEIEFFTISQEFKSEFFEYSKNNQKKLFEVEDIKDFSFIIDATGNSEVTKLLLEEKTKRFFMLNVVDVPLYCDFYFMALLNIGKVQIGVSSNGASPLLAKTIRDKIKNTLPQEPLENLLEMASDERENGIINKDKLESVANKIFAKAYIIGCGIGDVELLTLKAYKTIQSLEVALVDNLISEEIKAIIPKNCEIIDVGKAKGFHKKSQDEINQIFLEHLQKGKSVGRLKSGDPYLYGRGAEEALYLIQNDFSNIEVIPGVTSALSGCTVAGIPVTHRDISKSFSVVTAHLKNNSLNLDWIDLLKIPNHTTVVLMGLSRASQIKDAALQNGCDINLPCAIVSNASRENQEVLVTTLENLDITSKLTKQPSIIVFGDVVQFANILPKYKSTQEVNND
ncbi:MAG: uroporphyrinogen-III C-methyltransferase [Arcobacteraceae bacterium]|nr:uroporphyrinogen-III C-methyltransferase [Arcobacteraceae bacterium]